MNLRATVRVLRLAAATLALASLASPAFADAAPGAYNPPVCGGRDLLSDNALAPEALARAEAQRAGQLDNAQGLLWRVEKSGGAPSYLFGALLATDDRAADLARSAAAHILGARVVATEFGPFDKFSIMELTAAMTVKAIVKEGDTFAAIGAPGDVVLVENFLSARGVNAEFAHHLQLWFLAAVATTPIREARRRQSGFPLADQIIADTGKAFGVKVVGLDTIDEQTEILTSLDPALAMTILVNSARRPEFNENAYATLLNLYERKKPGEILPTMDASGVLTPQEIKAQDEFAAHLIGARNAIMAERLTPLIDDGPAFVAVGALHLIGKGGIIELLRARGYSVINVW
jgi:uncharacterized protein YbaP (TraB family)